MRMYWKLFCLIVTTTMCGACLSANSDQPSALQISNFRHGLVKFDSSQRPHIYKEGNNFPYEVNGTCIAAGEEAPCQWRGFEFSFRSPEEITVFECVSTSDRPQSQVYPDAVVATNSQTFHWGFSVKGHTGHYLRPQYTFDVVDSPLRMINICFNNGREALRWQVILTPPSAVKANKARPQSP